MRSTPIIRLFVLGLGIAALSVFAGVARATNTSTKQDKAGERVTLEAIGIDLGRLAMVLTEQTGIRHRVSRDIRDEKITVFVTDYPLQELHRHIATVFGYRWSRIPVKDSPDGYYLWRTNSVRRNQDELRRSRLD